MVEQFIRSQDIGSSKVHFSKYSMCMYEITNPHPDHTLYLNLYRLTNNSDIGIYFKSSEAKGAGSALAKKSPLLPKGYKETIHDYVPGDWKANATVPIETAEAKDHFQTFKVQYPARDDLFFDMNEHMQRVGAPFHNVSDVLRQYQFENVDQITIVVVGQSEESQFDLGLQVSMVSTSTKHLFEDNWGYFAIGCFLLLAAYLLILTVVYGVKAKSKGYSEF